ncbi:MAG: hypothetical protein WC667_07035 [Sulfurimonas sp.]|jgi:hypothetical protein
MKQLFTLSLFCITLLASSLQEVSPSFSQAEREILSKEIPSISALYNSKTYDLKKGWNKLTTPLDGVDVFNTFGTIAEVKFVVVYDSESKLWAAFSSEKLAGDLLLLKYLEPNVTFFVLADSGVKVDIKSNTINPACQKILEDKQYDFLLDSGRTQDSVVSKDKTMSAKSRYLSHHEKGIYNDTRIVLIYPKVEAKTKRSYKYGPALPKTFFEFSKEYEAKKFFVYDFKEQKCFEGIFPSMQIPPFPTLKETSVPLEGIKN